MSKLSALTTSRASILCRLCYIYIDFFPPFIFVDEKISFVWEEAFYSNGIPVTPSSIPIRPYIFADVIDDIFFPSSVFSSSSTFSSIFFLLLLLLLFGENVSRLRAHHRHGQRSRQRGLLPPRTKRRNKCFGITSATSTSLRSPFFRSVSRSSASTKRRRVDRTLAGRDDFLPQFRCDGGGGGGHFFGYESQRLTKIFAARRQRICSPQPSPHLRPCPNSNDDTMSNRRLLHRTSLRARS